MKADPSLRAAKPFIDQGVQKLPTGHDYLDRITLLKEDLNIIRCALALREWLSIFMRRLRRCGSRILQDARFEGYVEHVIVHTKKRRGSCQRYISAHPCLRMCACKNAIWFLPSWVLLVQHLYGGRSPWSMSIGIPRSFAYSSKSWRPLNLYDPIKIQIRRGHPIHAQRTAKATEARAFHEKKKTSSHSPQEIENVCDVYMYICACVCCIRGQGERICSGS